MLPNCKCCYYVLTFIFMVIWACPFNVDGRLNKYHIFVQLILLIAFFLYFHVISFEIKMSHMMFKNAFYLLFMLIFMFLSGKLNGWEENYVQDLSRYYSLRWVNETRLRLFLIKINFYMRKIEKLCTIKLWHLWIQVFNWYSVCCMNCII